MTTEELAERDLAAGPAAPDARRVVSLDDPRLVAWNAFLHAHARLTRRLDEELQAGHGISLAEYDALVQLAATPGRRLRMSVLADRVILSRSGVTRLVDRLEREGLVTRERCPEDGRGYNAVLTEAGEARVQKARATHLAGVRRLFIDKLGDADLLQLAAYWDKLVPGAAGTDAEWRRTAPEANAAGDFADA
jgi:DNA-binding MarR family transcriptional regulator